MSDMLQLVVVMRKIQFRRSEPLARPDDKLKHVGHWVDAFM